VLELMQLLQIPRGVYTSDLAVFSDTRGDVVDERHRFEGRHLSVYGRSKWEAHFRVAQPMMHAGLPLVIVMPGRVYGPGDTSQAGAALSRYLRGRGSLVPTRTAFNWAHASDVAWGHLLAMERGRPGWTYILGGPRHGVREVFTLAGRLAGKRREPFPVPARLLRPAAAGLRALSWPFPVLAGPAERLRLAAGVTQLADDSRARRELGFDPRQLSEGFPDTVRGLLEELMDEVR
jgi:nucleoside-diphosphate-sugar epimerase